MIKAMDFSWAAGTARGFTWVSIFWLGMTVCQGIQIQTIPRVPGQCGENVTLTCDVSAPQELGIKIFEWFRKSDTVWKWNCSDTGPELKCETTKGDSFHYKLTLTLISFKPINAGIYTCRLHSVQGITANKTTVEVGECRGNVTHFRNASHAGCSFQGVHPTGEVHWFQGETNLTDSCTTKQDRDQHGLYNISSFMHTKKENLKLPYNCSLWMPHLRRYHSWVQVPLEGVPSSHSAAGLKRICLVVEILILKLIM